MVVVVAPVANTITALIWVDIDRTGVVVAAVVANLVRNMWEVNLGRVRSFNVLILRLLLFFTCWRTNQHQTVEGWYFGSRTLACICLHIFFYLSLNDHDHDDQ